MRPRRRRPGRCPRPTSRARARRRPPGRRRRAGWPRPARRRRPTGRMRSSTARPLRMSGWWSRWRGLRRGLAGPGPRTGSPATVSRRPPRESSSMPPEAKPPVASTTASAGSARTRAAWRTPTPVTRPEATSTPDGVRARARAGPRPRPAPSVSARCRRMPGTHGGTVGTSATGAPSSSWRSSHASAARSSPTTAGSSDGLARARCAGAARRPGVAARPGRRARARGPARPTSARPGAGRPADLDRARLDGAPRQVGAAEVLRHQAGIEVLERAQPHHGQAGSVAQVAGRDARGRERRRARRPDGRRQEHVAAGVAPVAQARDQLAEPLQRLAQRLGGEAGVGVVRAAGHEGGQGLRQARRRARARSRGRRWSPATGAGRRRPWRRP